MIDYKKLFAMAGLIKRPQAIKAFTANRCVAWYDKREASAFRMLMTAPRPVSKYYVTPNTMKRVEAMDFTKLNVSWLESLYEKYGKECGLVFAEDKLHFIYAISANQVVLLCFKGNQTSPREVVELTSLKNTNKEKEHSDFSSQWYMTVLGGVVLSYTSGSIEYFPNSFFGVTLEALNGGKCKEVLCGKDYLHKTNLLLKEVEKMSVEEFKGNYVPKHELLKKEKELTEFQTTLLMKCVKMFLFIKTAKVMDLTFITEGGKSIPYNPGQPRQQGVIVVDSFYDADINVINPFSVSGHFRNQPKKNDKGEWYKELIYIDSYMKQGYHRKAKISVINQQKDELLKMELKER